MITAASSTQKEVAADKPSTYAACATLSVVFLRRVMPDSSAKPNDAVEVASKLPSPTQAPLDGFDAHAQESHSEQVVDAIEMIGEEKAAGFQPPAHSEISPGMRYLHSSRTIHQLVTDRNRAVGIYLAVASLLLTASSALMNANPRGELMVPIASIQRSCLPLTFAVMAGLAVLVALLLVRTRVGLIYEVAKMNALLGLPIGRVQRIGFLSIFFILQMIISLAGGFSSGLLTVFLLHAAGVPDHAALVGILVGVLISVLLLALYVFTVLYTTSDKRLQKIR
jgi:hypothetical protein